MKIDRSHTPWVVAVLLATLAAGLLYLANFHPQRLPVAVKLPGFFGEVPPSRHTVGGTPLGLVFGSVAFAIFLFASALGIRKKQRLWPIGSVQFWLAAHVWLTVLTIPLVLFHCGFTSGGTHTTALVVLYAIVMASGFFGLALQQFMPRMMKERLPREVVFEQIPHLRRRLFDSATKVRQSLREPGVAVTPGTTAHAAHAAAVPIDDPSAQTLARFLDDECLPYLAGTGGRGARLRENRTAADRFRVLKLGLSRQWHATIDDLELYCEDCRRMELQTRFQHWLHGWLLIHVPFSFALLVFTAWHAWVAVRFLVIVS